ncbi:Hint domain-containing protein [Yoonia sp. GPGPB17]|uniref:Hint domain-containing protein n=1 Tax=Yoonia sp. GPGPB17 TaxID=3026147 RepID=UPI0030C456CE
MGEHQELEISDRYIVEFDPTNPSNINLLNDVAFAMARVTDGFQTRSAWGSMQSGLPDNQTGGAGFGTAMGSIAGGMLDGIGSSFFTLKRIDPDFPHTAWELEDHWAAWERTGQPELIKQMFPNKNFAQQYVFTMSQFTNLTPEDLLRFNEYIQELPVEIRIELPVSYGGLKGAECFVPGTKILLANSFEVFIENIDLGSKVSAFATPQANRSKTFEIREVTRLYENVTQELIRLKFTDGRGDLVTTPGHAFLDETGSFTKIGDLVRLGGGKARIIDQSGDVIAAQAEWLHYSAETADMFEQASVKSMTVGGNLAYEEEVQTGWKTYNFEVEGLHTYIAGGVRVHNKSGPLGELGNRINHGLDKFAQDVFDAKPGGAFDQFTNIITEPFHWAGTALTSTLDFLGIETGISAERAYRLYKPNTDDLVIGDHNNDGVPDFFDPVSGRIFETDRHGRTPEEIAQGRQNAENLKNFWDGIKDLFGGDDGRQNTSNNPGGTPSRDKSRDKSDRKDRDKEKSKTDKEEKNLNRSSST